MIINTNWEEYCCCKLYSKEYYDELGFNVGIVLLRDSPFLAEEWVMVYRNIQKDYFRIEMKYSFLDYMYSEKCTLEEAKVKCPHILI